MVPEPTVAQTMMILRGLRDTFEAHHKVSITEDAIIAAAELSDRYITARFLPDKAIDLLDQAAARVKLSATARPVAVQELESELHQLRREQDYLASRKQYDKAAELGKRIEVKEAELKKLVEDWERERASGSAEVKAQHVAQIVSRLTGIPVNELTVEEREKLLHLEQRLHERLVGKTRPCGRWPTRYDCHGRGCAKAASRWLRSCSSARPAWVRPNSPRLWLKPSTAMRGALAHRHV